jgi:hypothetical protein
MSTTSSLSSWLSNSRYDPNGFGVVVATTQKSINAAMKLFLSDLQEPVANICFVANQQGNPVRMDYSTLVKNAKGSDPFDIPSDADPASNIDLQNLLRARFMVGIRAQVGLPPGYEPTKIPDIIRLPSKTGPVTFQLLCSQFDVVELNPGNVWVPSTWTKLSQPPGNAWVFESLVDLNFSTVERSKFDLLPPDVQAQLKNLGGGAFSVRQLLFDLANAGLSTTIPKIEGIEPGSTTYSVLNQYFLGAYFTELQKNGQPILGVSITHSDAPVSTLTVTNLNIMNNPFQDQNGLPVVDPSKEQQDLSTLNYVCAVNGQLLPPLVNFNWNWIADNESKDFDGVVAVNRSAFVTYFAHQIQRYVHPNCIKVDVNVSLSGAFKTEVNYRTTMTPGQTPTVTYGTDNTVLSFSYVSDASDEAGLNGDMGKLRLTSKYTLDVTFAGNKITITQHMLIYMYGRGLFGIHADGNIVDKAIVDEYTLAVTQDGKLASTLESKTTDNSADVSVGEFSNFWSGGINSITEDVKNFSSKVTSPEFKDIPVSIAQDFIFPGGKTFAFKSVAFSDHQDLVSHITYTDPTT